VENTESIQAAINAADENDTIIVKAGTYYECIIINKSLTLIGEVGAIVEGNGKRHTIEITANGVTLVGLTVNGSCNSPWSGIYVGSLYNNITGNVVLNHYYGIHVYDSSNNFLRGNILSGNRFNLRVWGLYLEHFIHDIDPSNKVNGKSVYYWVNKHDEQVPSDAGYVAIINSSNIIVKDLTLTNNGEGVLFAYTKNSTINNVTASNNLRGIRLLYSHENTVIGSKITDNYWCGIVVDTSLSNKVYENDISGNREYGVVLAYSSLLLIQSRYNVISRNNITNNQVGVDIWEAFENVVSCNVFRNDYRNIMFDSSRNNSIYGNLIRNGEFGLWLFRSGNNHIYHNSFVDNAIQVYTQDILSSNIWDNEYPSGGNYWSDYTGVDVDMDGIGETEYVIDNSNKDRYPLIALIHVFSVGPCNEVSFDVDVVSNSTVSNFQFSLTQRIMSFNASGPEDTLGFCRITIPSIVIQDLWENNYTVLADGNPPVTFRNWTDGTYTYLYFTFNHPEQKIVMIPEFSSNILLWLLLFFVLVMSKIMRRVRLEQMRSRR